MVGVQLAVELQVEFQVAVDVRVWILLDIPFVIYDELELKRNLLNGDTAPNIIKVSHIDLSLWILKEWSGVFMTDLFKENFFANLIEFLDRYLLIRLSRAAGSLSHLREYGLKHS